MSVVILLLAALPALVQAPAAGKPVTGNFEGLKAAGVIMKAPHLHWSPVECKDAPDGVYAKSGRTYYGCMKGKDVCSDEKNVIPRSMIAAFDARMRERDERRNAFRASVRQTLDEAEKMRPSRARAAASGSSRAASKQLSPRR
jgi:hypothetical protein